MPFFGKQSEENLATCHEDLVSVARTVIQVFNFSVICGKRDKVAQNAAFFANLSTKMFPMGKHNTEPKSEAMDVAPYPIDWNDRERFIYLAGYMMMAAYLLGIKIRWGGDWDSDTNMKDQTFFDLGHFEII